MPQQSEFNFDRLSASDGLTAWQNEREHTNHNWAVKLGLPVNRRVEARLKDGVILRGILRAGDVVLSLERFNRGKVALEVDGFAFSYAELESCVRLD